MSVMSVTETTWGLEQASSYGPRLLRAAVPPDPPFALVGEPFAARVCEPPRDGAPPHAYEVPPSYEDFPLVVPVRAVVLLVGEPLQPCAIPPSYAQPPALLSGARQSLPDVGAPRLAGVFVPALALFAPWPDRGKRIQEKINDEEKNVF